MLGLLETAPTLRRGTEILLAADDTCERQRKKVVTTTNKKRNFPNKSRHLHLLLRGLEPVVGRRQAVAVWRKPRSRVRLDEGQRGLVLLPGHLQQELQRGSGCG